MHRRSYNNARARGHTRGRGHTGSRGHAQARGSRHSATVRWHTVQPEVEVADEDPPRKKQKIKHGDFTHSQSGGVSSRTSFVNVNASPTKSQRHARSDIDWIETPCDTSGDQELCWVDPDFQSFIEDFSVNPPKRKRTAGVSPFLITITICSPTGRMTLFDCSYRKSRHFWMTSSGSKAVATLHTAPAHIAAYTNRKSGVWIVWAGIYCVVAVLFRAMYITLCIVYRQVTLICYGPR
jgi:hypothetical protein